MKKRWNILAAAVAVVSLLHVSPVLGQTPELVESLVVVDATGKKLGPVVTDGESKFDILGTPLVPFQVGDAVFLLHVFKTKFLGRGFFGDLWFDSAGCNVNGQFVVDLNDLPGLAIIPWSFVGADGATVYTQDSTAQPIQSFVALSRLRVSPFGVGSGPVWTCAEQEPPSTIATAIPAIQLVNMFNFFTPDFTVQAEVEKVKGPKNR